VLLEVEATLQAALVDLAGALTIRNGRLVRPLSHSGFGRRPRATAGQIELITEVRPADVATEAAEPEQPAVEDELAARRLAVAGRSTVKLVDVTGATLAGNDDSSPAPLRGRDASSPLRQAEEELAAAEARHWQSEFDLADAEGAVEAADDLLSSLDTKRIEARRDKVTAQRHLAEAKSRQREAVNALADARRRLDAARRLAEGDE
jgi:chromosome segregation ATPase